MNDTQHTQEKNSLESLARRFRNIRFDNHKDGSLNVFYKNDSSVGNRYISWRRIDAKPEPEEGDAVVSLEQVYDETQASACEWGHLFLGVHRGLIVGPRVLGAIDECLNIIQNAEEPEDDGKKVRHVNRLGGVNYVSKSTLHEWNLTDRLGNILSKAFFADRQDRLLYSENFTYVFASHSGWNRSC